MTNDNRALAILWLDTGQYLTETVARNFDLSIEELETELAIFRCSSVYVQTYAAYIERQKQALLKECTFSPWRDNFSIRTLPNNRIECIVAEEHSKLPLLYHAYLPSKDYLDHISDKTAWVGNDAFHYVLEYEQVSRWKSWTANSQLRFLVKRFDIAAFLPFRRTINYLEYERITGSAFPSDADSKVSRIRTPEYKTDKRIESRISEANECAYKAQLAESLRAPSIRFQKGNDWVDHLVTDDERAICNELISLPDVDRLKRMAEEGPHRTEWDLLRYLDHFYTKWELLEPMAEAEQSGDLSSLKSRVHDIWELEANHIAREGKRVSPQTYRKPDSSVNRQRAVGVERVPTMGGRSADDTPYRRPRGADAISMDRLLMMLYNVDTLEPNNPALNQIQEYVRTHTTTEVAKWYAQYRQVHRQRLSPAVVKELDEILLPSRAASREAAGDRPATITATSPAEAAQAEQTGLPSLPPMSSSVVSELGKESKGVVSEKKVVSEPEALDSMERRKWLLGRLRAGLDSVALDELQQTERELMALKPEDRPAGYPERDTWLLYLYATGKIKTEWDMPQRIMVKLNNDEVNEFLDYMSKGGK